MARKELNKRRVVISGGILTTIFMSLTSYVYSEIKKIPILEVKQKTIEANQQEMHKDIKDMSKKVYEMHGKLMR